MDREQFEVICLYLKDRQNLVAEGKKARWEATKWSVAANLGLAAAVASGAIKSPGLLLLFCVAVSIMGIFFVRFYDHKMTETRKSAMYLQKRLKGYGIDVDNLTGDRDEGIEYSTDKLPTWDLKESAVLQVVIAVSIFPSFVAWAVNFFG